MSIGLAFVQGLVGGFQKNIEREQTLRAADDQRLAGLQDMLFQGTIEAAKAGKPVPKFLGEKLKQAKTQVANRPSIGPFGTGIADRLDIDLTGLAGEMNSIGAAKKLMLGQGTYGIDVDQNYFDKSVFGKNPLAASEYYFAAAQKHFLKPENVKAFKEHLEKNPLEKESFIKEWTRITGDYTFGKAQTMNAEGQKLTRFPVPSEQYSLESLLGDSGILSEDVNEYDAKINAAKKKEKKDIFKDTKNTIYLEGIGEGQESTLFSYQLQDEDDIVGLDNGITGDEKYLALGRLAEKNGFVGLNAHSKFIKYFRNQLEKGPVNISEVTVDANGVRVATPNRIRDSYRMLFHAINLEHLGAGKKLTNANQSLILKYLDEAVGDNPADKINALASVIRVPESDLLQQQSQVKGTRVIGGIAKSADKLKAIIGITPTEFNEKYAAGKRTRDGLLKLKNLKMGERTASGIAQTVKSIIGNIVGPTGTFSQIGDMLSSRGENSPNTNAKTIAAIVKRLKEDGALGFARDVANISAQEAIMITLAADMARAVDPAGRLSNQDFEVQLRKLGSSRIFQAKTSELATLQEVINDFESKMKRIDQINLVMGSASDDFLDKRELQVLYANKRYNAMRDSIIPTIDGDDDEKKPIDPNELMPDGRRRFIPDGKNGFIDRLKKGAKV